GEGMVGGDRKSGGREQQYEKSHVDLLNSAFRGERDSENIRQSLAAFGAGKFHRLHTFLRGREVARDGHWLGKQLGVIDGDLVVDNGGTDQGEALGGMQIFAMKRNNPGKRSFVVEIRG